MPLIRGLVDSVRLMPSTASFSVTSPRIFQPMHFTMLHHTLQVRVCEAGRLVIQFVWKIFWIMPRGALSAAESSSSSSAELSDQDIALMLSWALRRLFAPGMGMAP